MDRFFESSQVPFAAWARTEPAVRLAEKLHGFPVQSFHEIGGTGFVAVAQIIFAGRGGSLHIGECCRVHAQGVAHVIQAVGPRQLRIEHRHHMTPFGIAPGIEVILSTQFGETMSGKEIANLTQNGETAACWFGFCFHPLIVRLGRKADQHFFNLSLWDYSELI